MRPLLVVAALSAVLSMATPAAVAQEPAETEFVAEPVPGSQTASTGGYFELDAIPGEEIRQSVGLRNDSDEELVLRLDAVDATTGPLGGVSYGLPQEALRGTGSWITLERPTVTLEPGGSEIVSFDVAVPADARSGTHLAGLSIAAPAHEADESDAVDGQAGASIDVRTRRIIAVQVELPGPDDPELVIGGVAPAARPDGLYLEIAIENRGYGLTKAKGVMTVGDGFEHAFEVDTFVPGTSIAYPVRWRTDAEEGEFDASVELRYGDQIAEWEGEFVIGEATVEELDERQVTPSEPGDDSVDSGGTVSVISAAAVAGAVVVVGAGGYALIRRRRSQRR